MNSAAMHVHTVAEFSSSVSLKHTLSNAKKKKRHHDACARARARACMYVCEPETPYARTRVCVFVSVYACARARVCVLKREGGRKREREGRRERAV